MPAENHAALVALAILPCSIFLLNFSFLIEIQSAWDTETVKIPESDYDNLFAIIFGKKLNLIRLHYR